MTLLASNWSLGQRSRHLIGTGRMKVQDSWSSDMLKESLACPFSIADSSFRVWLMLHTTPNSFPVACRHNLQPCSSMFFIAKISWATMWTLTTRHNTEESRPTHPPQIASATWTEHARTITGGSRLEASEQRSDHCPNTFNTPKQFAKQVFSLHKYAWDILVEGPRTSLPATYCYM